MGPSPWNASELGYLYWPQEATKALKAGKADTHRPTRTPEAHRRWGQPRACARTGLLAGLALAFFGLGCDDKERPRILIIGIDGASPEIAFPMLREGKLPHLAKIAAEGVSGPLRSVLPLFSPRIWNTIATGRPADQHGVFAFVKPSKNNDKELYLSGDRKVPALWNILSQSGRSVGVVNWWTTYPPEKINGVMVSDHFFPEQISMLKKTFKAERASLGALVHPEAWTERAQEQLLNPEALDEWPNFLAENDALPHWVVRPTLSQQFTTDQEITRVALGLQADYKPDVLMVLLPGIDRISHWLWGNLEPADSYPPGLQPSASEREAGANALRRYYMFTDALIGQLAADYGPDDLVLVLSDHGFEAGVSLMLLTGKHDTPAALNGVLFARGRGIPRGESAGRVNVFQIAPSVLAFADLPVPRDMAEEPAGFLGPIEPDWIASYDNMAIERHLPSRSGNEDVIIDHLRALGYLEDDSPQEENSKQTAP